MTPRIHILAAIALVTAGASQAEPIFKAELIFEPMKEDHEIVHGASIIQYPNGDLLTVWYETGDQRDDYYYTLEKDKHDSVRIGAAIKKKGATQWGDKFVISDTFGVSDNNPCLAVDKQDRLWLFHPVILGAPIHTWGGSILKFKVATDYQEGGVPNWDKEDILVVHPKGLDENAARVAHELRRDADRGNPNAEIAERLLEHLNDPFKRRLGWMTRIHPLILPDGTLMLPFANENFNMAAFAFTSDGGETWTFSEMVPGAGITQPSVVRMPDGKLLAFFRNAGRGDRIRRSESMDKGKTWSAVTDTTLPNPGASIEAIVLDTGELAIVYNNKPEKPRDDISISISQDGGNTWKWTRSIEHKTGGRYDYPSVIQAQDGSIHVTYGYNLDTIKHARFNLEWAKGG
jgi:predicted neuraminidase